MPIDRIAAVVRTVTQNPSRRDLAQGLLALAAGTTLARLFDPIAQGTLAKGKGKKKKKKRKPPCPLQCGFDCCPQTQPECCRGTLDTLCYHPEESCCPDLGGQMPAVCPPGTRCEFFDDPDDTIGAASFCCPSSHTTCGFGCCPPGSVCCPHEGDPGYAWSCCPDSTCDEIATDCSFVGDHIVDPRIF